MNHILSLFTQGWANVRERVLLNEVLGDIADALSCQVHVSPVLAIKGAGEGVAKNTEVCYGIVKGKLFTIADNTDMPALSGTVAADAFNVYVFDINSAGTITSTMGTEGATLATVKFPAKKREQTRLGYIIINPTGTGNFVGGTTDLDDATVVPNAVYVNVLGAWDHSFLR